MENHDIRPECIQRFDRLNEKLDGLIQRADRINGRYEKHMEEGIKYRRDVDRHEHMLNIIEKEKLNSAKASQWRVGLIVGLVMSIVTVAVKIWVK